MSSQNPQQNDSHALIPNIILEALMQTRLSTYEFLVLLKICRETFGWNKKSDVISLAQFVNATKIPKPHVIRTLSRLIKQNIITSRGNGKTAKYGVNIHVETWKSLPKQVTLPKQVMTALPLEVISKPSQTIPVAPKEVVYQLVSKIPKKYLKDIVPGELFVDKKLAVEPVGVTDLDDTAYEVLKHLNDKAHHHFALDPLSIIEIKKRLKAGATVKQLNLIIDFKVDEWWNNPDMKKYLDNVTLFRNCNYAKYLEAAMEWNDRKANSMDAFMVKPEDLQKVTPLTDEQRESLKRQVYGTDSPDDD